MLTSSTWRAAIWRTTGVLFLYISIFRVQRQCDGRRGGTRALFGCAESIEQQTRTHDPEHADEGMLPECELRSVGGPLRRQCVP